MEYHNPNNPDCHLIETNIEVRPSEMYAWLFMMPYFLVNAVVFGLVLFTGIKNISYINMVLLLAFLTSLIYLFIGAYRMFELMNTFFTITQEQIIIRTGILSRHFNYLELYRVKDIEVDEPFLLRIFGLMNFTILSIDKNSANLVLTMRGIKSSNLPQTVRDLVQAARMKNRVAEVDIGNLR